MTATIFQDEFQLYYFLSLPFFIWMTADTYLNCVLTAISKLYHMLSIIVGTYFFGMMSNLLVKTGSDINPHFALKASAPPVCIANSSMCAVIPTCYNNSDFSFLATKYADDGLVFSTVSMLNCVYGFPEALGLVMTYFNIVAFLALPWLLLFPFMRVRITGSFFLILSRRS
jgi:hypothetical protein